MEAAVSLLSPVIITVRNPHGTEPLETLGQAAF